MKIGVLGLSEISVYIMTKTEPFLAIFAYSYTRFFETKEGRGVRAS